MGNDLFGRKALNLIFGEDSSEGVRKLYDLAARAIFNSDLDGFRELNKEKLDEYEAEAAKLRNFIGKKGKDSITRRDFDDTVYYLKSCAGNDPETKLMISVFSALLFALLFKA